MKSANLTALQAIAHRQIARGAARTIAFAIGFLARAYRARRDSRHLMGLDDYLLKDMGIARSEIGTVVRDGQSTRWH
jgi:uncharacterized protein YjiS (DUF1127 family)